jgi:hypothetical protein
MALNLRVAFIGGKRLERDLQKAQARIVPELEKNMNTAALLVLGDAQRRIRGSRTRSFFEVVGGRRKRRKTPRAVTAKPNETGIFEGRLRQSASHDIRRKGAKVIDVELGFATVYAPVHENGLRAGFGNRPMPRRPFLGPAIKAKAEAVFRIIGRTFKVIP